MEHLIIIFPWYFGVAQFQSTAVNLITDTCQDCSDIFQRLHLSGVLGTEDWWSSVSFCNFDSNCWLKSGCDLPLLVDEFGDFISGFWWESYGDIMNIIEMWCLVHDFFRVVMYCYLIFLREYHHPWTVFFFRFLAKHVFFLATNIFSILYAIMQEIHDFFVNNIICLYWTKDLIDNHCSIFPCSIMQYHVICFWY